MNLSDYVVSFLENKGIKNVFTVSGGGSIFLCDALYRAKKLRYVCNHHEQAVAMSAEAYSRCSNKIGASIVTTGPGGTNSITGTACCWIDSIPTITISGQVFLNQTIGNSGLRQLGVQEINIIDIVKPITKYAVMVTDPLTIGFHLEKAFYIATSGRPGPVWIDIPANIQNSQINIRKLKIFTENKSKKKTNKSLTERKISKIIKLLNKSKRPIIHAGHGVRLSKSKDLLLKFIEKNNLPLLTSWNGADLIEDSHKLFIGRPGTFSSRAPNFALQKCDLYISIGTRLPYAITGYDSQDYAREAVKIMVDIDKNELNKKSLKINLKVNSDAKDFLQKICQKRLKNTKRFDKWILNCKKWVKRYPIIDPKYKFQRNSVNSYYFIDQLSKNLKGNDIIVTDMGLSFVGTYQAIRVKKNQKIFTNSGHAPMGWGLPAAIGACIAANRKKIILLSGEGGLQMNIQELATIMHEKLPIKIFIYNNGGYLTIKQTQQLGFKSRIMGSDKKSGISFPDYKKISQSHKISYIKINNHKYMYKKISKFLISNKPGICELILDNEQPQIPKAINKRLEDGTIQPSKLDDLYPFLDPQELKEVLDV
ncbi:MAG: Acetolactate synthase large subunit [Alphaproteobacteria bacterium MarineAlpha5_Bin12]|nr:MAG: Acetolactate synthase large subunit [Alphaproteobacteria bacterium MarineAlpha5_Bin12]